MDKPRISITGHALDRLSTTRAKIGWKRTRIVSGDKMEGQFSWLRRTATEAWNGEEVVEYKGVVYVFVGKHLATLATVYVADDHSRAAMGLAPTANLAYTPPQPWLKRVLQAAKPRRKAMR